MAAEKQVRLDKWLWAARFYKTRALAANAITNGRVKVNDARTKPSKQLSVDDKINIQLSPMSWDIQVKELSSRGCQLTWLKISIRSPLKVSIKETR